jgi:hypothetical protein
VNLGTIDLVGMVLSDILGVVLGKIFFNGNCLSMIYLFGQVLLLCCIRSLVQMCGNILGGVSSHVLLSKSFLSFWYSLGLEEVFGSVDGLIVFLFVFNALFNSLSNYLLL